MTDLFGKVALLGTWIAIGRSVTPDEFGTFAGLTATAILASAIWDAGVSQLLTKELARAADRDATVARSLSLRLITFPLGVLAFGAGTYVVFSASAVDGETVAAFGLVAICSSLGLLAVAYLRAAGAFGRAGVSLATGRWIGLGGVLVAVHLDPTLTGLSLCVALGECGGLLTALALSRAIRWAAPGGDSSESLNLRAALPFALNGLLGTAYNRFDIVILTSLTTAFEVGRYAPASRLQDAAFILPNAVAIVALPVAAHLAYADPSLSSLRRLMRSLVAAGVIVSLPLTLVCLVYTEQLLTTVLGAQYISAATPTRIALASLPFAMCAAPLLAGIAAVDRAADTSKVFALAFAVSISLHLVLDPPLGAVGGAIATLSREPFVVAATFGFAYRAGVIFEKREMNQNNAR